MPAGATIGPCPGVQPTAWPSGFLTSGAITPSNPAAPSAPSRRRDACVRSRRIDRMVHGRAIGTELHRAHVAARRQRQRVDELPVAIALPRLQHEGTRHRRHEIGRPELPAVRERGRRRQIRRVPFGRPGVRPAPNQRDLIRAQPAGAEELVIAGRRHPRRHLPRTRRARDVVSMLLRVRVLQQRKGRDLPGPMTGDAIGVEDRRDVLRERGVLRAGCWGAVLQSSVLRCRSPPGPRATARKPSHEAHEESQTHRRDTASKA